MNAWRANGQFVSDTPETMGGRLCIKDGREVVAVTWDEETRQQIVRAVNSHSDLMAALQQIVRECDGLNQGPRGAQLARAALAKAAGHVTG